MLFKIRRIIVFSQTTKEKNDKKLSLKIKNNQSNSSFKNQQNDEKNSINVNLIVPKEENNELINKIESNEMNIENNENYGNHENTNNDKSRDKSQDKNKSKDNSIDEYKIDQDYFDKSLIKKKNYLDKFCFEELKFHRQLLEAKSCEIEAYEDINDYDSKKSEQEAEIKFNRIFTN